MKRSPTDPATLLPKLSSRESRDRSSFHIVADGNPHCKRNIEMTPLCKIEVTHPLVLGSREVRSGGVVDEQAGVQAVLTFCCGFSRVVCVSLMPVC